MKTLTLIAVLLLTANVAGAENYTCSNGKTTFYITEEDLKEQPESKDCGGGWCIEGYTLDTSNCKCVKEQPSSKTEHCKELTFKGTLKCDGVTMDMSEKSDAEKWREKIFVSVCRIQNPDACRWVVAEIIEKRGKMWLVKMEDKEPEWANSEYLVWEKY